MSQRNLEVGDLVTFTNQEMEGLGGVVSQPISEESAGYVLVTMDGYIRGLEASIEDVALADEASRGYVQLAYNLIKLGSHVIESRLIRGR
jgi:hypothetical protein